MSFTYGLPNPGVCTLLAGLTFFSQPVKWAYMEVCSYWVLWREEVGEVYLMIRKGTKSEHGGGEGSRCTYAQKDLHVTDVTKPCSLNTQSLNK
jgi:hypothetical protein